MEDKQAVLVTTAHRGVFFGYMVDDSGSVVTLSRARNCLRWVGVRGFLGLASEGPNERCRIGPAADKLTLRDVTSMASVTDAAIARWEAAPWSP